MWVYGNLYIIAGIATVVAFAQVIWNFSFVNITISLNFYYSVLQLFVIFLARTLEGQIQRQKSLWMH
jgi:hypothetical protein